MPFLTECPHCHSRRSYGDRALDKKVLCPDCQLTFVAARIETAGPRKPVAKGEAGKGSKRGLVIGVVAVIVLAAGLGVWLWMR